MSIAFVCPRCGHNLHVPVQYAGQQGTCPQCQAPVMIPATGPVPYPPPQDIGDDPGMRMLLPVGRSVWAILSGYLALFSIALFPLGPFALITGIVAVRDIKKNPRTHGMGRAIFGIVVGSVTTVLLAFMIFALIMAE